MPDVRAVMIADEEVFKQIYPQTSAGAVSNLGPAIDAYFEQFVEPELDEKVDKFQGIANKGKVLYVGDDGYQALKEIDTSTSDKRTDSFENLLTDVTSVYLTNEVPDIDYISVIVDNTALNKKNYKLEDDKRTLTFITPVKVQPAPGSTIDVTYELHIGTFTDVYTKKEVDDKIGTIADGLKNFLDGVT